MIEVDGQKLDNLFLIAGPCVVETEKIVLQTAEHLNKIATKLEFPLIFKSSYRKANRLSNQSFTGIGDQQALRILEKVKEEFSLPILTDIHEISEVVSAAEVCDVLQIPAFLCRQTTLIEAAAKTGKVVNIKKGQFLAPEDLLVTAEKAVDAGCKNLMLTERGTTFGYHNLVVDYRSLLIMKESGHSIVFDATHSVQRPSGKGKTSGGDRQFIPALSKAAVAVGIDGLFFETHPEPEKAKSDAATQLPLADVENYLMEVRKIAEATA